MKQQDLWDALAGDGNQPWPAEALYEVEGLNYHEALKVLKLHQAGEPLPSYDDLREVIAQREAEGFDLARSKDKESASKAIPLLVKAARRKAMAAALGVTDPREQGDLAREAGAALDRVATAAKKAGVDLDLSRRGSRRELLEVSARIYSAMATMAAAHDPKLGLNVSAEQAVQGAAALIAEVDAAVAPQAKFEGEGGICPVCRTSAPVSPATGRIDIHRCPKAHAEGLYGECPGAGREPLIEIVAQGPEAL